MIDLFKPGTQFKQDFLVSETVYENFMSLFRDKNPLHTVEEFAKIKGFKGKVMHGNILNGFLSYFIGECLPVKDVIIHSQEIHFKSPVYMNDELQFEAVISDVFESVKAVQFNFTFKKAEAKEVAKGKIQIGILI